MSEVSPPTVVKVIPASVETDTPCRKCGYNLRGLERTALCPECGSLVSLSIRNELIHHSDPVWIDQLRRGVTLVRWSTAAIVAGIVFQIMALRQPGGEPAAAERTGWPVQNIVDSAGKLMEKNSPEITPGCFCSMYSFNHLPHTAGSGVFLSSQVVVSDPRFSSTPIKNGALLPGILT